MKGIFEKIKVKDNEKVTDKALASNLVAAVIGIILCLASLTAATWAWFGDSVLSASNTVQTGSYSVSAQVKNSSAEQLEAKKDAEGKEYYELSAGERYEITLTGEGTISGGYCILEYGENELLTERIFTAANEDTPKRISFYVVPSENIKLYISSSWGKYGGTPDINDGGDYVLTSVFPSVESPEGGAE